MSRAAILLLTSLGFALRLHALGDVPMRWDEGWSIALATLPAREIFRLTALDVHPPLYYLSLAPWLALASGPELWLRALSAIAGTTAIPLAASAASSWWRPAGPAARRAGLFAAAYAAIAPAFVYYAGVTRMYALTTPLLLLAVVGLARFAARGRSTDAALAVLGVVGALYTFYYTGFALAGLFAAALLAWPRAWRRTLTVGLVSALAYAPWLLYAAPRMTGRVAERTGPSGIDLPGILRLMDDGLLAGLFLYELRWPAVAVTLFVLAAGVVAARPRLASRLGLVVLPVLAALIGAALGAQAHMFAARYTIVATPFLVLGLGWAVAGLWGRQRGLGAVAGLAVLAVALPTLTGYVYAREAEVSGAYDPAADWRALEPRSAPDDLVAFNILSLAGAYERHRTPTDPAWTYAQVWDPVREPPATAIGRVQAASASHPRLWLVLYRGTASPGSAALKEWADQTLYPTDGWWRDGTLYQGYVTAIPDKGVSPDTVLGGAARLVDATFTSQAQPGTGVAVNLMWRADAVPSADARVFVHAYDTEGTLVAQHDGFPAFDTRPPTTWQPGERIYDRHGLYIPPDAVGPFRLVVGMYDHETGRRWTTPDGTDGITIGQVKAEG